MQKLLDSLKDAFPSLRFTAGNTFYWSPETNEVFYKTSTTDSNHIWSLLHETGHGLLGHAHYKTDVELLKMEVAAWDKAKGLAQHFGVAIDEEHIQDCLDTYRDWLYRRSLCPGCGTQCLQADASSHYRCFNCHTRWHVSPSRFCRAYRRAQHKKSAPVFALQHYR